MADNYDFRTSGFLGGFMQAKADHQADIEFEQRKQMNALKLRALTTEVEEYIEDAPYRKTKKSQELQKNELWIEQAEITVDKMNRDYDDQTLDSLAEQVGMIETEEEYQAFKAQLPEDSLKYYNVPETWQEGGEQFAKHFLNQRVLNLETRRRLMQERIKNANKAKNAKDKDKLPSKVLQDHAYLRLSGDPEFAEMGDMEREGLAAAIVSRARSLMEHAEDLDYDTAYEVAKGAILAEQTVLDPGSPGWTDPTGLTGTWFAEDPSRRMATPEDRMPQVGQVHTLQDGTQVEIIEILGDGRIKIKDVKTGRTGTVTP